MARTRTPASQLPNPLRPRSEASYPTTQLPNWRWKRPGFSLIEILLSLFLMSTFVIIILTSTLVLKTRFATDKHVLANRIASKEIERLRNLSWSSIGPTSIHTSSYPSDYTADFAELNKSSSNQAVFNEDIFLYPGNTDIYQVVINISWDLKNAPYFTEYQTLISKDGLHGS